MAYGVSPTASSAGQSTADQQADDRTVLKRSPVACNRCRGRKTKCAGTPPYPCIACEVAGHECVYSEAEKRVYVSESYLLSLQTQARSAGDAQRSRAPSGALSSSSTCIGAGGKSANDDDWWFKGSHNLFLNRSGEHHFVGASSSTHLAKRLNPMSGNLAWDMRPMYDDPTSLRRPVNPTLPQLPPFEFGKRLYAAQYAYIGTIFSFLQPEDFEERLNQVYNQRLDFASRESCLSYCQVLLVFAYGQMYSVNQWTGNDGPPGFVYFKHALRLLPDIHEEGSILFVEVLSYVAYYMQNLNRRDAAFLYVGLALRMALSLGLHQEVSDPTIDAVEREHRRRVWWSVYSLDRILCVKSGNPITIQDEDIDIPWPLAEIASPSTPWPSVVLAHYTQLSRILGKIGEEIYRKKSKSGSSLLASVQSIMNDLSAWLRNAPDGLKVDFESLDTYLNREAVSAFLHFYSCVNMTARPLVFYVIQQRLEAEVQGSAPASWKEGLSPNIVAVIDHSIMAARTTISIMSAAAKHNLVATYGYLDGEYAFSAALLLVMANAAFPHSESNRVAMEQGLSLLRSMAEKGNNYLGARHSLLLDLQSVIGPKRGKNLSGSGVVPASSNCSVAPAIQKDSWGDATPRTALLQTEQLLQHAAPFQDMSFDFNIDDDPRLWEEVLDNIDIDMDTDWIESALRRS